MVGRMSDDSTPYQPLHPALFTYDPAFIERFIHPSVARVEPGSGPSLVTELCEQVYQFRLFTPDFCAAARMAGQFI